MTLKKLPVRNAAQPGYPKRNDAELSRRTFIRWIGAASATAFTVGCAGGSEAEIPQVPKEMDVDSDRQEPRLAGLPPGLQLPNWPVVRFPREGNHLARNAKGKAVPYFVTLTVEHGFEQEILREEAAILAEADRFIAQELKPGMSLHQQDEALMYVLRDFTRALLEKRGVPPESLIRIQPRIDF